MKIAVILGVTHMMLGIIIKMTNNVRNRNYLDLLALTIPQFTFMAVTFVYMDFLIVFKWLNRYDSETAPSIISTMIAIYAQFGTDDDAPVLFHSEHQTERILFYAALLMIPIMLFAKPLYIYCTRKPAYNSTLIQEEDLID